MRQTQKGARLTSAWKVSDYLIKTITKSTGLPLVFFDSCATPRPMNCTSPRAHEVFAGLPSTDSDICVGASAMTT